jgi:hypothetical protein
MGSEVGIPSADPSEASNAHEPLRSSKATASESVFAALMIGQTAITVMWAAIVLPLTALVWISLQITAVAPVLGGVMAYASLALLVGVSFWFMLRFFLPAFLEFIHGALFARGQDRLSLTTVDEIIQRRLRGLRADIAKLRNPWRA